MPTADEFWHVATQVVSERGGLVVGFAENATQPELGSTLDNVLGFTAPRPPTVVSLSDWTDWREQVDAFYRLRPYWGRGKVGDPKAKYYRVKFRDLDGIASNSLSRSITHSPFPSSLSIPSFGGYAEPASTLQGAPFWIRLLARLIDFVIHYLTGFIAGLIFVFLLAVASGGQPPLWVLRRISVIHVPVFIAALFGAVAYQVICTSIYGSTLGKLLLSLQVVKDDGSLCPPKSAIIREVAYFVDAMFFGIVGYMAVRGDIQQKRYGDQWAGTIVMKRANVPPASRQGALRFVLGLMLGISADIAFMMIGLLVQMNS
ncbi:MAG TPA: RDD family protein [Candidatus Sulfotelmatobacter sp.]|nr:RDD family protein [Candidatus Sulfotelmatobacter sp.]